MAVSVMTATPPKLTPLFCDPENKIIRLKSSGDSGVSPHGGASFKVEKAHFQKGRKGAGVKGAGVANCRIFRSAVPSIVVWSILLVSLSGVKKKL